ncbi:MAG: hypothetical protein ACKOE9_04345 [Vulcanococcus sp.]
MEPADPLPVIDLRRLRAALPALPPELTVLPGWRQRRRVCWLWAAAAALMLLRPLWPLQLLPGWLVAGLLLWAIAELVLVVWWPRRWR